MADIFKTLKKARGIGSGGTVWGNIVN